MSSTKLGWLGSPCIMLLFAGSAIHAVTLQSGVDYTWPGKYSFRDSYDVNSNWNCLWLGYGTGEVRSGWLWLTPLTSTSPGETHSALVRSKFALTSTWDISVVVATDKQLRTTKVRRRTVPSPNPWEVAWIIANMVDDGSAGIYFMLKTNGVELGAYARGGFDHIYLDTSSDPKLELGKSYVYRFVNDGKILTAMVDGAPVATASLAGLSGWVLGNRIGLYTEDAAVRFGTVTVSGTP